MHGIGKQKEKKTFTNPKIFQISTWKVFLLKYIYYKNLTEFGNHCRSTPELLFNLTFLTGYQMFTLTVDIT